MCVEERDVFLCRWEGCGSVQKRGVCVRVGYWIEESNLCVKGKGKWMYR